MTEHSLILLKGEKLRCTTCHTMVVGEDVRLVVGPRDDEMFMEVLCKKCSDKRGE